MKSIINKNDPLNIAIIGSIIIVASSLLGSNSLTPIAVGILFSVAIFVKGKGNHFLRTVNPDVKPPRKDDENEQ